MAFLDNIGFTYAWGKMKAYFQPKEVGKGLSTNDFTTEEKTKLAGLEDYTLPQATETVLGGIKAKPRAGENSEVAIDATSGKLYVAAAGTYELPTMATDTKGGAKLGEGLTITDETLSIDTTEVATVDYITGLDLIARIEFETFEDIVAPDTTLLTVASTVTGAINELDGDIATINTALANKANLVGGKIPAAELPSYVDDVVEVATLADLPTTGESGKIYITADTNITYRWSGTAYVAIGSDLALGETASTAFRGDQGKTAYDHSQITTGNPHGTTLADLGLAQATETVLGTVKAKVRTTEAGEVVIDTATGLMYFDKDVAITNAEIDAIMV